MNMKTKSVLIAAAAAMVVTPILAKSGSKGGKTVTNSLHNSLKATFVNDGVEASNASGTVAVAQTTQGNTDKQTLTVTVKNLTASNSYSVFVATIGSTNETDIDDFTVNNKGAATLKFTNGKVGKSNIALP